MPIKRLLMGREGTNPSRPPLPVVRHVTVDRDRISPFLHGMARVIDVGGCLRQADAAGARRAYRELIEELDHSGIDVVIIGRDWEALGQDFQFVVGTAVDQGTLTEATYE